MGEIDDIYQEKIETLENEFFESFKNKKGRKETLEEYHENLNALVSDFEKKYSKQLKKERDILKKRKKKEKKEEAYPVLRVDHLDFNPSRTERLTFALRIFLFRLGRNYRRITSDSIPPIFFYWGCKIKIFIRGTFREISELISNLLHSISWGVTSLSKKLYKWAFELSRGIFSWTKNVILKLFRKKSKKSEEKKEEKDEKETNSDKGEAGKDE